MTRLDGRALRRRHMMETDYIVVGSGPAGASAARELALSGADVVVVEAGPWVDPTEFPLSALASMSTHYRSWGTTVVAGSAPVPYLQGKMVGGSSPINGAICWLTPRDIYD